jgi:hypothetical protein
MLRDTRQGNHRLPNLHQISDLRIVIEDKFPSKPPIPNYPLSFKWMLPLLNVIRALRQNHIDGGHPQPTIRRLRIVMMARQHRTRNTRLRIFERRQLDEINNVFTREFVDRQLFSTGANGFPHWNTLTRIDFDVICNGQRRSQYFTRVPPLVQGAPRIYQRFTRP